MKEFLIIAVFFLIHGRSKKKYQLCLTKWELETGHYLWGWGEGRVKWSRKWWALNFFLVEHGGPWEVKRRVGGGVLNFPLVGLISILLFSLICFNALPYFGIMFEEGSWIFLNDWRGYPPSLLRLRSWQALISYRHYWRGDVWLENCVAYIVFRWWYRLKNSSIKGNYTCCS